MVKQPPSTKLIIEEVIWKLQTEIFQTIIPNLIFLSVLTINLRFHNILYYISNCALDLLYMQYWVLETNRL